MRSGSLTAVLLGAALGSAVVACSMSPSAPPPGAEPTAAIEAAPTQPPVPAVTDADDHGFTVFGGGARCHGGDIAEMFMRTDESALVVCRTDANARYYRGYRMSDGAGIELTVVARTPEGFVAVNAPDNARYVITAEGFTLLQNGAAVVSETAVESGPVGWATSSADEPAPTTEAEPSASAVVLGSASWAGPDSHGYGSERPTVISLGTCASAVSQIVWQDWGAPVSRGSGLGCDRQGSPPRYDLVASDLGMCHGVPAYRTVSIGGFGNPQNICDDR